MKKLLISFVVIIPALAAAQITITYNDYEQAFQVGKTYKTFASESGAVVSVFVGSASSTTQTWDFSSLTGSHVGNSVSVNPGSAPFYSQFPATNVCLYGKVFFPGEDTTENWQYQHLDADKLTMLAVSDLTSMILEYDPPALQAVVPLTFGSKWVSERDSTYITQNVWLIKETNAIIDGFGTMKLSSGDYPCLRLTFEYLGILHGPLGIDTTKTRGYHWYARNLAEFHIPFISEDQFNQTTIDVTGLSWSVPYGASGIDEQDPSENNPLLLTNFPNPFSNTTIISFWLPEPGIVNLTIYDYLGNEIKILVGETLGAGRHEFHFKADGLAQGLYFSRLTYGKYEQTRKMVVK